VPNGWFRLNELLFHRTEKNDRTGSNKSVFEFIKNNPNEFDAIYSSIGAQSRITKLTSKKVYADLRKNFKISFNRRNLFVFEKAYQAVNRHFLDQSGIGYSSFEGPVFDYMTIDKGSRAGALWCAGKIFFSFRQAGP